MKGIFGTKKRLLSLAATALAMACGPENPYEGMSMQEVIAAVSTPEEAQDFINFNATYDPARYTPLEQRPANGAELRSFRTFFEKDKGVCRDGSIAVAAMLQDDNYPALSLGITCPLPGSNLGHQVFIYQENGKWGSAGINALDFSPPSYGTLQALMSSFVKGCHNYSVYDFSKIDLVEGTNDGVVLDTPFLVNQTFRGERELEGRIEETSEGYTSHHAGPSFMARVREDGEIVHEPTGEYRTITRRYDDQFTLLSRKTVLVGDDGVSYENEYTSLDQNEQGWSTRIRWTERDARCFRCKPPNEFLSDTTCAFTYKTRFLTDSVCEGTTIRHNGTPRFIRKERRHADGCIFREPSVDPVSSMSCVSDETVGTSMDGDRIIDETHQTIAGGKRVGTPHNL